MKVEYYKAVVENVNLQVHNGDMYIMIEYYRCPNIRSQVEKIPLYDFRNYGYVVQLLSDFGKTVLSQFNYDECYVIVYKEGNISKSRFIPRIDDMRDRIIEEMECNR